MADKDFKTIEEQLEILRSRGLTINDESQAKDFLLRNSLPYPTSHFYILFLSSLSKMLLPTPLA